MTLTFPVTVDRFAPRASSTLMLTERFAAPDGVLYTIVNGTESEPFALMWLLPA
jgi:hypothetical protein